MQDRQKDAALECITEHIDMSMKRAVEITKEMVAKFFLVNSSVPEASLPVHQGTTG